jgi:hypothetical protein
VTDTHSDQSGKVELAADICSKVPVTVSIGPVVHVDDVAGGKMEALLTRAEARDFIDAAGSPGPGCKNSPPAGTLASDDLNYG